MNCSSIDNSPEFNKLKVNEHDCYMIKRIIDD